MTTQSNFLHNTKISSSKFSEDKALKKRRDVTIKPGRAISLMEQYQSLLSYSEVHTDMNFILIPTCPLELRAGVEKTVPKIATDARTNDAFYTGIIPQLVRNDKDLPSWRLHSENEIVILKGLIDNRISVDQITKFSVRPPELSYLFDQLVNYFRWFTFDSEYLDREKMEIEINDDISRSSWIDGFHKKSIFEI